MKNSTLQTLICGLGLAGFTARCEQDALFVEREKKFAPEPRTNHAERIAAAEAKRQRRMKRNLKNLKR